MANCKQLICVFVISAFIHTSSSYTAELTQGKSQLITFYRNLNCAGQSQTFTESNSDLDKHWVTNATSYYVDGMWRIHFARRDNPDLGSTTLTHSLGKCGDEVDSRSQIIKVERYGSLNKEAPEITLFTDRSLNGTYIDNKSQRQFTLDQPIMIQSYVFTGNHTWTTFSGINFKGTSKTLIPSQSVQNIGYGITYSWITQMPFGSARIIVSGSDSSSQITLRSSNTIIMFIVVGILFKHYID